MIIKNIRISSIYFNKIFETSSSFVKRIENLSGSGYFVRNLLSFYSLLILIIIGIYFFLTFIIKGNYLFENLLISIILASSISFLSIKLGFLTYSGAMAAFIIAVPIFGFGGLKWSVPVLVFFILSSTLTRYAEYRNPLVKDFFSKSGKRDHIQVLANGGIAAVLVVLNQIFSDQQELIYPVFVSSLSAVCADTWATETGTIFKSKTVSILNFKNVSPGTSGGISMTGTLGAIGGAFIIALSSLFWIRQNIFYYVVLITAAGFIGSFVDSFLGAAFQRKNICIVCGKSTEKNTHCGKLSVHCSGIKWFSNDLVNLCCSAAGASFTYLVKIA